ncbi:MULTISPECIES: hypothetical protein [Rhodococcus]|uniref:hypothetical protein n=1 Tax=Rhodococcus TaxID=1827 RepID=UPI0002DCB2B3|nr:hypothetical protein [Rhodococcus jostii]
MESSVRRLRVDGALLRHQLVRELVMIGLLRIPGVTVVRAAKNDSSRQVADAVTIAKRRRKVGTDDAQQLRSRE